MEKLFLLKEQILQKISFLRINYNRCIDAGMKDTGSVLYNKICDILDKTEASDSIEGLEEVVFLGQIIEKDLERWMIAIGQTTTSISWPKTS